MCCSFVQRSSAVVVDGATKGHVLPESDPNSFSRATGSVLGPRLFILYTSEMFELEENRLNAYADDSSLLAVVRKPADRPEVAASQGHG